MCVCVCVLNKYIFDVCICCQKSNSLLYMFFNRWWGWWWVWVEATCCWSTMSTACFSLRTTSRCQQSLLWPALLFYWSVGSWARGSVSRSLLFCRDWWGYLWTCIKKLSTCWTRLGFEVTQHILSVCFSLSCGLLSSKFCVGVGLLSFWKGTRVTPPHHFPQYYVKMIMHGYSVGSVFLFSWIQRWLSWLRSFTTIQAAVWTTSLELWMLHRKMCVSNNALRPI